MVWEKRSNHLKIKKNALNGLPRQIVKVLEDGPGLKTIS